MDDIIIMRSSFIIVFKILRALDKALSQEQVDPEKFNADAFEATETRWRKLLEMLQEAGYIKGVKIVKRDFIDGETETEIEVENIQITLKGLQYLAENSAFAKIGKFLDKSLQVVSAVK